MGAFVISYIVGSIVAIPFLAFHLLRTRRELNALRAELQARGVIAPGGGGARAALAEPPRGMVQPASSPPAPRLPERVITPR